MPDHDRAFLAEVRRVADQIVSPWPAGKAFDELSPARAKAVIHAVESLMRLAQTDSAGNQKEQTSTKSRPKRTMDQDVEAITEEVEQRVGVSLAELSALFVLDGINGFGPQKFKAMHDQGVMAQQAVENPSSLRLPGRVGNQLSDALRAITGHQRQLAYARAARQLAVAAEHDAQILTYHHPSYPPKVIRSNNPIPVLYFRGDATALVTKVSVACVGSRGIRQPYAELQAAFSTHVAQRGYAVVSGFALGADSIAHRGALAGGGVTLCVMPGGLDRPFPPENRELWQQFLNTRGVGFISEFPFGTGASAMNLRKRNKLIVAAADGVLVGQSASKGGAMNAFRFAREQHKSVATFADDGQFDTSGNREIARDERILTVTFPLEPSPEEWQAWLSTLS